MHSRAIWPCLVKDTWSKPAFKESSILAYNTLYEVPSMHKLQKLLSTVSNYGGLMLLTTVCKVSS